MTNLLLYPPILGALVGDALGVPFEFKRGDQIPRVVDMVMPADYPKSHGGIPYGTWSDDGAQLLCLLESLLRNEGRYVAEDFARLLIAWYQNARHQSGGRVFDCGLQTSAALDRILAGTPPGQAGSRDDRANGNGALMRVMAVPVAGRLFGLDEAAVMAIADAQSLPTHGHAKSRACCALYSLIAARLLKAEALDVDGALHDARAHFASDADMQAAFEAIERYGRNEIPRGGGYVIDSFWSALFAVRTSDSYSATVVKAVRFGNDTDTTSCIAGGLAGILWGIGGEKGIPEKWLAALRIPEESRRLPGIDPFSGFDQAAAGKQ